ncbi:uncharacterized protein TNCV_3033391 [Trichonephila clavipes]|nr:uncharacterized protein TNCV_3033391 [Trichonephila clavipes]
MSGVHDFSRSTQKIPGNERADQKTKQRAESTQLEVPLTLRRAKSTISTHIDKYTTITQKRRVLESHGKLAIVGPITRHLERTESIACFRLTTGHDFLGVYLHWLGVAANEACPSEAMPEWMGSTCSKALDSMITRLMTLSVGTGSLGVKWSRSQTRALDK